MAHFRTFHAHRNETLSGTSGVDEYDLPTAWPVSRVWLRHNVTHATSIDIDINRVDVIADGEDTIFGRLPGLQLQRLAKYLLGRQPTRTAAAGTDFTDVQYLQFGRFPRDGGIFLPAPLFNDLKVVIDWDTNSVTPASSRVDLVVEQIKPRGGRQNLRSFMEGSAFRRFKQVNSYSPNANDTEETEFSTRRNLALANVFIDDGGTADNIDGDILEFGVNDFDTSKIRLTRALLDEINRLEHDFHDDARPTDMFRLGMDLLADVRDALPTAGKDNIKLRTEADGTPSGTVRIFSDQYVALNLG